MNSILRQVRKNLCLTQDVLYETLVDDIPVLLDELTK